MISIFKNTIFVILNPRLKTLDTILPILLELDKKKVNIFIYSPDELTSKSIKENIVINDCINNIAKLIFYENKNNYFNFLLKKIWEFKLFLKILFKILFNKIDFIYFSELKGKKSLLKFLKYNVFLCENDPYGHTKFIEKTKKLEREKLLGIKIKSSSFKLPRQNMLLFTNNFYNLNNNINNQKVSFWSYTDLKLSTSWINYVKDNKKKYFEQEFKRNKIQYSDKIISISLGIFNKDFGWDKTGKIMEILLIDCLKEILKLNLNIPIFLKPYPISSKGKDIENLNILYNILSDIKYDKYVITYLHPMILAQNSLFMIANSNTANFADFKYFGVPTIEYTHYSDELLTLTKYNSIRPDWATYFINHDQLKLRNCLNQIVLNKKNSTALSLKQRDNINNLIIDRLNGNKKSKIKSYEEISSYLN